MKHIIVLGFLIVLLACEEKIITENTIETLKVKVNTYRDGIRVYTEGNKFLGLSPVTLSLPLRIVHDMNTKIKRYFVNGQEVHAGEKWPLKLKVYQEGFPEPFTLSVPFEPGQWQQEVTVEKKKQ